MSRLTLAFVTALVVLNTNSSHSCVGPATRLCRGPDGPWRTGDVLQNDSAVRVARGFGNYQQLYMVRGLPVYSDDMSYNGLDTPLTTLATMAVCR